MADVILITAAGAVAPAEHAAAAETHAGTEAHGGAAAEHHAEPSALGMGPGAWVALAMLILIGIMLWKKVPAMIGAMLDSKIATIRQQLDEAAALRTEAEALKAEYQQRLSALDAETAALRERAQIEADAVVAKAQQELQQLIARRQKMAEDRIAAAERTAIADVREQATRAAVAAATQLIAERHDAASDRALIDAAIAQVVRV